MNNILFYLLEISFMWLTIFIAYRWIAQTISYRHSRYFLIGASLLALLVPFISLPQMGWQLETLIEASLPALTIHPESNISSTARTSTSGGIWPWIFMLYSIGVAVMLLQMVTGLVRIQYLKIRGKKRTHKGRRLIVHPSVQAPFSFGKLIFWSDDWNYSSEEKEMILSHEQAHIEGRHTFDVLCMAVMRSLFWFHPFVYWLDSKIKEIHEYEADASTIQKFDTQSYIKFLVQHLTRARMVLAHSIFHSPIKKRILMMKENTNTRPAPWRWLGAIVLFTAVSFAIACSDDVQRPAESSNADQSYTWDDVPVDQSSHTADPDKIFKRVEQIPRFPGCEDEPEDKREKCAQKKLLEFIYNELIYPEEAKEAGAEGRVIARFVVRKDGSISDIEVLRDIGHGTAEEVKRVINEMNVQGKSWTPGMHQGKKVNVQFTLPFNFKL